MFVCKKKYPPSNIGVIIVEKIGGKMKKLATIGVAYNQGGAKNLSMEQKNGFSERNPEVFSNSICMVTSLKHCDRERE